MDLVDKSKIMINDERIIIHIILIMTVAKDSNNHYEFYPIILITEQRCEQLHEKH